MRRLLLLLSAAGCGGAPAPERSQPVREPPPVVTKRPHTMQPHELIVQGVPAEGVQRARIARLGEVTLSLGGESLTSPGWASDWNGPVAIAQVADGKVRLVHEDDDARLLLWIDRADLAPVLTREVRLGDDGTLAAGTPVTRGADGAIRVEIEDLVLDAVVDPDAIGDLWSAAPTEARVGRASITGPIHATPDRDARVIATATEIVSIVERGSAHGWTEVETIGPLVRVHGYVADHQLSLDTRGTGTGHGYGVSHKIDVEVPAGACLYDAIDGEVIGVNLVARTRYAERGEAPGWFRVLVYSPWALLRIPAHDGGDGFDMCATLAP